MITAAQKHTLTEELKGLEGSRDSVPARHLVRSVKSFIEKMKNTPRWDDSKSAIGASFSNLWSDSKDNKPYLRYVDITARARALLADASSKLTPQEAEAENVSVLQRIDSSGLVEQSQQLNRPGGDFFNVVRHTPQPLVQEAVRRGGQVKDVGGKVSDELAPVGQSAVDELDKQGVLNPALGVVALSMFIMMKNKMLAVALIIGMLYLTKQRQIREAKAKISAATDKVTAAADKVTSIADRI